MPPESTIDDSSLFPRGCVFSGGSVGCVASTSRAVLAGFVLGAAGAGCALVDAVRADDDSDFDSDSGTSSDSSAGVSIFPAAP